MTVADQLRVDILDGHLAPGQRLREVPLAEVYACSRAAIRAAILQLAAEGLVDRETNRGARVRRHTVEQAVQITEARAALESLIARRAAEVATERERRELTALIERMRAAVAADRPGDYSRLNLELHRRLRDVSGHGVAAELVDNLGNRAAHHQYRLSMMPGRPTRSLPEHEAIVQAVVSGDPDAAYNAMHAHLASGLDALREWGNSPSG